MMHSNSKFIFFLPLLLCLLSFASIGMAAPVKDSVKGTLVNEKGDPVPGATILLKERAGVASYKITSSDARGQFSFENVGKGNYLVEINMMGYAGITNLQITVGSGKTTVDLGVLRLTPATQTLGEVVVKSEVKAIDRQADKTTFNVENSINSAGSSAMEIVEKLPGVQVNQDGQINLNGKPGVQIYVDGKAMRLSPEDLANLLRGMPSANIQKIEVRSNPSAQYDAAGNAGIINIIRKKNRQEDLNGSINGAISQGRYPKFNGGFNLSLKRKWYNIYLNYAYVYREIFVDADLASSFFSADNQLKIGYKANNYHHRYYNVHTPTIGADLNLSSKTTLSFIASRGIQYFDNNTDAHSDIFNSSYNKTGSYDFTNKLNDKLFNYSASTRLIHQLDSTGGTLTADLDYANYSTTSNQHITNITRDATDNWLNTARIDLDQGRDLDIYSAKADLSKKIFGNIRFDAGVKASYVRSENDSRTYNIISGNKITDSTGSNHFIYTEHINAAYLSLGRDFRKLTVQLGLRAEQTISEGKMLQHEIPPVKQNYFNLFPSVMLNYKINKQHELSIRSGRRINRPAYEDMNALRRYVNPTTYFEGNPLLRPEISYKHELTYAYRNELFITLGYQDVKDYVIRWVTPLNNDSAGIRKPENVHHSTYYTADLAYSRKLYPWWTTSNGFTVYRPSFSGNINGFSLLDKDMVSFNFNTSNTFTITDDLSAELNYKYLYKNQDGATISASKSALDIGIKQSLFHHRGSVSLNVSDVFWSDINRFTVHSGNVQDVMDARFDTRVVRVSLNYGFGNGQIKKRRSATATDEEKRRAGN